MMKHFLWLIFHYCPYCKSPEVHRSRRQGVFETLLLPLFLLRPFRCHRCNHRSYNFFFRKKPVAHRDASRLAS